MSIAGSQVTKRVTLHVLRHMAAMDLLQEGGEQSVIALWLGRDDPELHRGQPRDGGENSRTDYIAQWEVRPRSFRGQVTRFLKGL